MIPIEDAVHKRAIDRTAVNLQELRQLFAPLVERRAALTRPDERIERKARNALGMTFREHRRPECARRDSVHRELFNAARLHDIAGCRNRIVGAVSDVAIDIASLIRTTVAFHIEAPGVVTERREIIHG